MLFARLEPGSGSGIGNKVIIISAKHTEEYGVVHGSSNHTRKNTKEYGVFHVERIIIIIIIIILKTEKPGWLIGHTYEF